MTTLTIDPATRAKLHNLNELLEIRDESGRLLGYFHPSGQPEASYVPGLPSPFSDEELQRRRQQRSGRPLTEIMQDLENQ